MWSLGCNSANHVNGRSGDGHQIKQIWRRFYPGLGSAMGGWLDCYSSSSSPCPGVIKCTSVLANRIGRTDGVTNINNNNLPKTVGAKSIKVSLCRVGVLNWYLHHVPSTSSSTHAQVRSIQTAYKAHRVGSNNYYLWLHPLRVARPKKLK